MILLLLLKIFLLVCSAGWLLAGVNEGAPLAFGIGLLIAIPTLMFL